MGLKSFFKKSVPLSQNSVHICVSLLSTLFLMFNSIFLQNTKSLKDFLWNTLKPLSIPCSLVVAFAVWYIQKVIHSRICIRKCVLSSELQVCSVILKWLELSMSWIWVFPWQQFYFMINQLLYIMVIIIRMDRHSVAYTHGSNLRAPFIILLSCFLQLLWCYSVVPLIWYVWTSR